MEKHLNKVLKLLGNRDVEFDLKHNKLAIYSEDLDSLNEESHREIRSLLDAVNDEIASIRDTKLIFRVDNNTREVEVVRVGIV